MRSELLCVARCRVVDVVRSYVVVVVVRGGVWCLPREVENECGSQQPTANDETAKKATQQHHDTKTCTKLKLKNSIIILLYF